MLSFQGNQIIRQNREIACGRNEIVENSFNLNIILGKEMRAAFQHTFRNAV